MISLFWELKKLYKFHLGVLDPSKCCCYYHHHWIQLAIGSIVKWSSRKVGHYKINCSAITLCLGIWEFVPKLIYNIWSYMQEFNSKFWFSLDILQNQRVELNSLPLPLLRGFSWNNCEGAFNYSAIIETLWSYCKGLRFWE